MIETIFYNDNQLRSAERKPDLVYNWLFVWNFLFKIFLQMKRHSATGTGKRSGCPCQRVTMATAQTRRQTECRQTECTKVRYIARDLWYNFSVYLSRRTSAWFFWPDFVVTMAEMQSQLVRYRNGSSSYSSLFLAFRKWYASHLPMDLCVSQDGR